MDDEGDVDPGASSSGQPRTEPGPDRGAGSGKDDDVTLPDIVRDGEEEGRHGRGSGRLQEGLHRDEGAHASGY